MPSNMPNKPLIDSTAKIAPTAIVNLKYRPLLSGTFPKYPKTKIGHDVFVGHYSLIGEGCKIDPNVIIDDFSKIECGVTIGPRTLIQYGARICNDTKIGSDCVIGGFITERVRIGDGCRVFGNILHKHKSLEAGWDDDTAQEPSAVIQAHVFVGFGACIIGPVRIGKSAYIAANAVVTKDVPDNCIVKGTNIISKRTIQDEKS